MFHVSRSRLVSSLFSLALLAGGWSVTACVEAGLQSGVFACNTDSECPPGGFYCENYLNTYMYFSDVTARPVMHDYWGFCNSENEVIEKQKSPATILVEICTNNRDDDGDGAVDCADLECQTSPTCRAIIDRECAEETDDTFACSTRLGFPLIRNGVDPTDATCPEAVGFFGDGTAAEFNNLCLPRCRLYLPYKLPTGQQDSNDADFFGSDEYCNTVVDPRLITAARFSGGDLRCEHVTVEVNTVSKKIQNDVCLPPQTTAEISMTDCGDCESAGNDCMVVTVQERTMLAWDNANSKMVYIGSHTVDQVQKHRVYCMPK